MVFDLPNITFKNWKMSVENVATMHGFLHVSATDSSIIV